MYNTDLPNRAELPSTRQLIRSTVIALVAASALLTTTVLPSEYGIDPTGVGRMLGLTQMGEIKVLLAAEAAADVKAAPTPAAAGQTAPTVAAPRVAPDAANVVAAAPTTPSAAPMSPAPAPAAAGSQRHEMTITLRPGQAAEVKLDMRKGAQVTYVWQTSGGQVNFDTHGDPPNPPKDFYHGYGKGRAAVGDKGTLEAAFDGKHGRFWRNRGAADVSVKLNTAGQYTAIKRVL
jgi:hypothetical protein